MSDDLFESIEEFLKERPTQVLDQKPLLTDEQTEALILAIARGRDEDGFCEHEVQGLLEWATFVMVEWSVLGLIFEGILDITDFSKEDGPTVKLSEKGKDATL